MSFSRINYDDCAYNLQVDRSVAPGNYRLYYGYSNNCNTCYPYNGPIGSKEEVSSTNQKCKTNLGDRAKIESELSNRNIPLQHCNNQNDSYKQNAVVHKPMCDNTLLSEDTRFSNPLDDYRGMSLTGFHFNPFVHANPQCHIQNNKLRSGSSSRLMTRDAYSIPNQIQWDEGGALPPKIKPVPKKGCKTCCQ